jgi:hypothetical protein
MTGTSGGGEYNGPVDGVTGVSSMNRDVTVPISLAMIAIPLGIGLAIGMPQHITSDDPPIFHALFWIIFIGAIRATVLWFETLIHGVKYAKEENRVAVVLSHVFLGPIMAYGYYFTVQLDRGASPAVGRE